MGWRFSDYIKLKCKTSYKTDNKDHLKLHVGDEIILLETSAGELWNGRNVKGSVGCFQKDCVDVQGVKMARVMKSFTAEDRLDITVEKGEELVILREENDAADMGDACVIQDPNDGNRNGYIPKSHSHVEIFYTDA